MQGYAQDICRTLFFVGLGIEVDAPVVLAAIRPWSLHGSLCRRLCMRREGKERVERDA